MYFFSSGIPSNQYFVVFVRYIGKKGTVPITTIWWKGKLWVRELFSILRSLDGINKHFLSNSCTFSIFYSHLMVESSITNVIDVKNVFRHVQYTHISHLQDKHYILHMMCPSLYWLDPLEICLNKFKEVNALTIRCCVAIAFGINNIHRWVSFLRKCVLNFIWFYF